MHPEDWVSNGSLVVKCDGGGKEYCVVILSPTPFPALFISSLPGLLRSPHKTARVKGVLQSPSWLVCGVSHTSWPSSHLIGL
jgi:hypothetical protein